MRGRREAMSWVLGLAATALLSLLAAITWRTPGPMKGSMCHGGPWAFAAPSSGATIAPGSSIFVAPRIRSGELRIEGWSNGERIDLFPVREASLGSPLWRIRVPDELTGPLDIEVLLTRTSMVECDRTYAHGAPCYGPAKTRTQTIEEASYVVSRDAPRPRAWALDVSQLGVATMDWTPVVPIYYWWITPSVRTTLYRMEWARSYEDYREGRRQIATIADPVLAVPSIPDNDEIFWSFEESGCPKGQFFCPQMGLYVGVSTVGSEGEGAVPEEPLFVSPWQRGNGLILDRRYRTLPAAQWATVLTAPALVGLHSPITMDYVAPGPLPLILPFGSFALGMLLLQRRRWLWRLAQVGVVQCAVVVTLTGTVHLLSTRGAVWGDKAWVLGLVGLVVAVGFRAGDARLPKS